MACIICDMIKKNIYLLYSDNNISVLLHPDSAVYGHIIIAPTKHKVIMEELDNSELKAMSNFVSIIGKVMINTLKCEGINIIMNSGDGAGQTIPHVHVELVPRYSNDNIKLGWEPKKISNEDLGKIELILKNSLENKQIRKENKKPEKEEKKEVINNNFIEELRRIP